MGEGRETGNDGRLLATTGGTGGDEDTGVLARKGTGGPKAASCVPEGLELGGEVTVTGGDTEEETTTLLVSRRCT